MNTSMPADQAGTAIQRSPAAVVARARIMSRPALQPWYRRAWFLILAMVVMGTALAATTGTWTIAGNTATSPAAGVTVTWSGATGSAYSNGTLNTTNYWTNPYGASVAGNNSLQMLLDDIRDFTRTITVTFSKAVNDPVLHVDRLGGGENGINSSSLWTMSGSTSTGGSVTLTRLSGNAVFVVAGNSFQRITGTTDGGNTECSTDPLNSTACGSIRFNGTGITSLTFTVTGTGPLDDTAQDGVEVVWTIAGSTVAITKQSVGGTGTFNFTGTNGVGSPALNTATSNPISSTAFGVTNHAANITITEAATAGFVLQTAVCRDQANAIVTSSLAGSTLTILAANYRANQAINCTFTNAKQALLTLVKRVTNDNGGTATVANFNVTTNAGALTFGAATGAAPTLSYTSNTLSVNAGTYTLVESDAANYAEGTWTCTGTGASGVLGTFNAGAVTLAAGAVVTCEITNNDSNLADLQVTKSNGTTTSTSGAPTTYTVTVSNPGPASASGAVVRDIPGAGLSNCAVPPQPAGCSAAGGAACPATPANVLAAGGVAIPTLPAGGTVTFTVTCTMN